MRRQLPQPRELLELMQFKAPDLNARRRRLSAALTIEDLRAIAKRRTPRAAFDYTDGAAESELSLARARQAFADVEFNPGVLRDVSTVDTSREMLGGSSALPSAFALSGCTLLLVTEGEDAGVGAAQAAGVTLSLSPHRTTWMEDVPAASPLGRKWSQLHVMRKREFSFDLVVLAAHE